MSLKMIASMYGGSRLPQAPGGPTPTDPTPVAALERTLINDHDYSAFPWPDTLPSGEIVMAYKKSLTHAAAGDMMFYKSSNGGSTGTKVQIVVGGTPVQCSNLGLKVFGSRIIINWQTDPYTSPMYFAYSDDKGVTWISAGSVVYHPNGNSGASTGYAAAQFGKMIKLPSGKIMQSWYDAPLQSGLNQHSGFVYSVDNGASWSLGGNYISNQTGTSFPNGAHSELYLLVTHPGATDATTKMVAVQRNETYEAFTHYRSADGGATWTRNDTYLINVLVDNPLSDKYPVHTVLFNGLVYIFFGMRKTGDYYIGYVTCTPDDFYNNTGYSAVNKIYSMNADSNGSSYDCGYPEWFIDAKGNLCVMFYDTASDYSDTVSTLRWEIIYQLPVITTPS